MQMPEQEQQELQPRPASLRSIADILARASAAVLETGGLAGKEFHAFLKGQASSEPLLRAAQLQDVRQRLASALQLGNAALMLGAAGAQLRPWRSALQGIGGNGLRRRPGPSLTARGAR